ncbi:hypothetical protein EJ04DRAFT_517686 [Polyplosphaeria fusca]|uniref:Uncharacterized protein n=1 Tax=Polyplosphaeria fusca TaxID=682080 RepID=A0A9P4UVE9_9PLEO|nr:hypothetical protein EJ04DRAFT_517686 [Polyplosphaeria fusca]
MVVNGCVDRAQANLDIALQTLQLNTTIHVQEKAEGHAASFEQHFILVHHRQLQGINLIQSMGHRSSHSMEDISTDSARLQRMMGEMGNQLQQQNTQQHAILNQIAAAVGNQKIMTTSAHAEGLHSNDSICATRRARASQSRRQCSCLKLQSLRRLPSWFSTFVWQSDTAHRSSCPLLARSIRPDSVGARFDYHGRLFTYVVDVALSYTRSAGGFSVSPTLRLGRVVSRENPAFRLFDFWGQTSEERKLMLLKPANETLGHFMQVWDQGFRDGLVGPGDVDQQGNILLHRACTLISLCHDKWSDPPTAEQSHDFISFLINAGVPVNTTSYGQR